jgi:predicted SAM-dependent methyltransferase
MEKTHLKLNLGCGTTAPEGWLNIDSSPNVLLAKIPGNKFLKKLLYSMHLMSEEGYKAQWQRNIVYCNLTKSFPSLPPNSCSVIYTSHFLEHIPLENAKKLILRAYQMLTPGGILRIAVPDLFMEAKNYVERVTISLNDSTNDWKAAGDFINLMVLKSNRHSHVWMYDFISLSHILRETGFRNIEQKKFLESEIKDIDLVEMRQDSLFVECKK